MTDPDAQHIELQESMVEAGSLSVVHEEMVHEGATPGRQRTEQVAQGEEPSAGSSTTAAPWQKAGQDSYHEHQRNAWKLKQIQKSITISSIM